MRYKLLIVLYVFGCTQDLAGPECNGTGSGYFDHGFPGFLELEAGLELAMQVLTHARSFIFEVIFLILISLSVVMHIFYCVCLAVFELLYTILLPLLLDVVRFAFLVAVDTMIYVHKVLLPLLYNLTIFVQSHSALLWALTESYEIVYRHTGHSVRQIYRYRRVFYLPPPRVSIYLLVILLLRMTLTQDCVTCSASGNYTSSSLIIYIQ